MASFAASNTTTRLGRLAHWVFPSRQSVALAAAVEGAAMLLGLPLPLHALIGVLAHVVIALLA